MPKQIAILIGYVLACLSVGVSFPLLAGGIPQFEDFAIFAAMTGVYALPGFVILRGAMWIMKTENILVFVAAGTLNALVSMAVFFLTMFPSLFVSGAIAGAVCMLSEWILGKVWPRNRQMTGTA